MPTFIKPNGSEIEINDTSVKHALSLGWTEKKAAPKKKAKPKSKEA